MKNALPFKLNFMTLGVAMLLAGATASCLFTTPAAAGTGKDVQRLSEAKISLTDAIGIAEKHVGGKAVDAELDSNFGKVVYDVSVIKDNAEHEIRIDAVSGDIVKEKIDKD